MAQQAASLHTDLDDILTAALPEFQALFACDGVGLWINGRWTSIGSTPPKGAEDELVRFISSVADGRIWSTKRLSEDYPPASAYFEDVSGVMAVPLSESSRIVCTKTDMFGSISCGLPAWNIWCSIQDGAKRAPTE